MPHRFSSFLFAMMNTTSESVSNLQAIDYTLQSIRDDTDLNKRLYLSLFI